MFVNFGAFDTCYVELTNTERPICLPMAPLMTDASLAPVLNRHPPFSKPLVKLWIDFASPNLSHGWENQMRNFNFVHLVSLFSFLLSYLQCTSLLHLFIVCFPVFRLPVSSSSFHELCAPIRPSPRLDLALLHYLSRIERAIQKTCMPRPPKTIVYSCLTCNS